MKGEKIWKGWYRFIMWSVIVHSSLHTDSYLVCSRTNMAIGVPEWEQQVYMPPEPPRLEQTNISTTGKPSLHLLPIFAPGKNMLVIIMPTCTHSQMTRNIIIVYFHCTLGQNRRRSSEGMEAEPTKNSMKISVENNYC